MRTGSWSVSRQDRLQSCLLAAWLLVGCTDPATRENTVLTVTVDADSVVRDETVRVEIEVDTELEERAGWRELERRSFRADPRPIHWPIEFRLDPTRKVAESYALLATALDSRGAVVARAQAIRSGSQVLEGGLRVHFETQCFRQPLLCSEGTTCHRGACVSARDDSPLPAADAGPTSPVAGEPPRAPTDQAQGLALEGGDCARDGDLACMDHASRSPLQCDGGHWRAATACNEDERCDTGNGEGRGTCKPIARECMNQQANVPFCDAEKMLVCTDLVSSLVRPCDEHQRCAQGPMGAACKCESGFALDRGRCVMATECGADQGGCDPLTRCTMGAAGVRTCTACPAGYTGSGELGCSPDLQGLTIDGGELEPAFSPSVHAYRVKVPVVMPRVAITARAPMGSRVSFDALPVEDGQAWMSPVLEIGERNVTLRLSTDFGESTEYALTVERTAEQRTYIKASNAERDDWFGFALSLSGNSLVAGAFHEDSPATGVDGNQGNGAEDSGAAYVFTRTGQSWTQEAYLKPNDTKAGDLFGTSVSIDGDTIAVGALHVDFNSAPTSTARSGVAYVFARTGGAWMQRQQLAASNARPGDKFGIAMDLEADTLAVGAVYGGATNGPRGGAVYVFGRDAMGWTERQILTPSVASGQFGSSIQLDGDRMLIGAPGEENSTGATYLFVRRDGQWSEQLRLQPDSLEAGSKFGYSVTLLGDRIAAGAPHHPDGDSTAPVPPGEVYVFEREADQWQQTALLRAPTAYTSDYFGANVLLSRWGLAIGANGDSSHGRGVNADASSHDSMYSGAAYLYANTARTVWKPSVYLKPENSRMDCAFGYQIALGPDMLISAAPLESAAARGIDDTPSSNIGSIYSGAIYVFQ